jgi:predicted O-linked N-acetylglucosamine transferase (SPINDLY family)
MDPATPETIRQALETAARHHQSGDLRRAELLYRQVLSVAPDHPDALHFLGLIAHQVGQHESAWELMRRAIARNPSAANYYGNAAPVLAALGKLDEAIRACRQAIALRPDYAEAHDNLGVALRARGKLDEAIAAYRLAVAMRPDYAKAWHDLGVALSEQGELPEAIACHRRSVAIRPDAPDTWANLAACLEETGDLEEAIACCRRALSLRSECREAILVLGKALKEQGGLEESAAAYRRAILLTPHAPEPYNDLGNVLQEKGELDEAIAAFRHAIALRPDFAPAHNNLANALKAAGQLDEAIESYRRACALTDNPRVWGNLLHSLHLHPDYGPEQLLKEHREWNRRFAEPLAAQVRPHDNDPSPDRRLRVGYVSPDFGNHPVGRFLLPLLSNHDHARFEIFCYAGVKRPDPFTERLRECADVWVPTAGTSDERLARRIGEDRIDILVDLTMHSQGARMLLFARKPAPVQIAYLAYCSTTGLSTMDNRLTDPYFDPPAGDESCYTERSISLPETYWCYPAPQDAPMPGPLPARAQGHVTFGCLNNFVKVNARVIDTWGAALRATPDSRLLLHSPEGSHRRRVIEAFGKAGVGAARIEFVGRLPMGHYFEQYLRIDIALDPFPFAGGTTSCDALWMGVPVVSLAGRTAVSRAGFSVLSNVGAAELVARTPEEYVRIAAGLAADRPRLESFRLTMRDRMRNSPLMDAPRFARNVEAAYRQAWHSWAAARAAPA